MSDIKLFRVDTGGVAELPGTAMAVEKSLQSLLERNLETFLGVRFLATEYPTGKTHAGRIDTLGIDENNSPVIIEYKRSTNQNVINQGLFYLDWLLDHKAEFTLLAMKTLGSDMEGKIDWSAPRLVCIAGDFTRYDEHAVQQINRNIELLRYRNYDGGYLVLELVNATTGAVETSDGRSTAPRSTRQTSRSVTDYYDSAPVELRQLFEDLEALLLSLGDDVTKKTLKYYFAFRRIKNFACVEIHPQSATLLAYLKVDPDDVPLQEGFTRDVRTIGHFGTGDLEVRIKTSDDLERAKPLLLTSYEAS
jgi:predicted transport protein/RecB family endonuclease NucS